MAHSHILVGAGASVANPLRETFNSHVGDPCGLATSRAQGDVDYRVKTGNDVDESKFTKAGIS